MPQWAYAFFHEFYQMSEAEVDAIPGVHAAYCDIVCDICRETQTAMLVDVFEQWRHEDSQARFRGDQIHLTEIGHSDLADILLEVWQRKKER